MAKEVVVSALPKVEILKANHNSLAAAPAVLKVVSALPKVEILKANHNSTTTSRSCWKLYLLYLK